MSSDITFPRKTHTARTAKYRCDHCTQPIEIGQRYERIRGIWDGTPGVFRAHPECEEAANAWRDHHDSMWDEGCVLVSDVEQEDHEWLLAEFPIVAERLRIVAP